MLKVVTFYKYISLESPRYWMHKFRWVCSELNLLGRILVAEEGVNGAICGEKESIKEFKRKIKESEEFSDLTFRVQNCKEQVYHKLTVKVRKEVIVFVNKVDLRKKGEYIGPEELKVKLDNRENNREKLILLDARDEHEYKVGKFKNAVTLPMNNFRDFPEAVKILEPYKNNKIVMYCTGGIRCEKSSAFLKQRGYKNVYQLKGGIIDFISKFPDTYFEGSCFVFDDRLTASSGKPITTCIHCSKEEDRYLNCHNLDCDRLFICCENCEEENNYCCSSECRNSKRQRKKIAVVARYAR